MTLSETNPYQPPQHVPDQLSIGIQADWPQVNAVRRIAISTTLTFLSGVASHVARRTWPDTPLGHLDALGFILFLVLVSLWLTYWCSKFRLPDAYRWFHIGLAGCWVGGIIGWQLTEFCFPKFSHLVDDIFTILGMWYVGAAIVGSLVVFVFHRFTAKRSARSATQ